MGQWETVCSSIATTIADYRQNEIAALTPEHVERWVEQFSIIEVSKAEQLELLQELDHVLRQTYFSKRKVDRFLNSLVRFHPLVYDNPEAFWKSANFLRIQRRGNSQTDMLAVFDTVLERTLGLKTEMCGSIGGPYIYLDDCLFTGNRIIHDMNDWLINSAPNGTVVHIIVIAQYASGLWQAKRKVAQAAGNDATVNWWRAIEIEDRKSMINVSQVLRPHRLPDELLATEYEQELANAGYPPVLRRVLGTASNPPFSSELRRQKLEQAFLRAGLYIRSQYQSPKRNMRPLGFMALTTLGFGALTVTYRNCANNCPLALWWGDMDATPVDTFGKWYPLFPRKTNDEFVSSIVWNL